MTDEQKAKFEEFKAKLLKSRKEANLPIDDTTMSNLLGAMADGGNWDLYNRNPNLKSVGVSMGFTTSNDLRKAIGLWIEEK